MGARPAAYDKPDSGCVSGDLQEQVGTLGLAQHAHPRNIAFSFGMRLDGGSSPRDAADDIRLRLPFMGKRRQLSSMLEEEPFGL